ncbi:sn-glycerol-3-phosphate ABC transporter ATP-binding protein UgpC [Tateyamaria omphalii]|uniref:ABC transporter ATP-binding protein n=1 Tax=Tateyamaria omphalii TaxID=299262 RepID=UPI001C9A01D0|nr:sn-glycerol-3-phosphate ABC transporter ATP-binding protein UgpC [Tateyamaria omphalii]MBY5931989.1 sn-glycerol-3-phosphate ABC transporter ATP-binding protein UgpC [Tateyamaria omphalii]
MALDDTDTSRALSVRGLRKTYGAVEVLHDLDIDMAEGEFLVLVGPSGCGKSTLLNCIAGLEEISSGRLFIGGRDVTQEPPKDRDIAMVFQSYALYPTMSVGENIGFGMKIRGIPKDKMQQKIQSVAELLQIDHLLDRKPSQLSGGQRQRVAMGRALVREPRLFLFDEPLSNLDAKLRVEMRAEIKRLHMKTGASIVYVTHDQVEAMTLASRIVVLKGGHVQQIGTPAEIYDTPANTFVADFMGSPPMNLIPATFADGYLQIGDSRIATSLSNLPRDVLVGVRPEHFSFAEEGAIVEANPSMMEDTGSDTFLTFEWGGVDVLARMQARFAPGSNRVPLSFDRAYATIFDADTQVRLATGL